MALLVYALVDRSFSISRLRGIEHEPLRLVRVGKAAAVIGSVRRRLEPNTASIRRYDDIVRMLAERTTAILPARFGTTVADVHEIQQLLHARQRPLARALGHVRGRAQMTVRLMLEPAIDSPEPRAVDASRVNAMGRGAAYLRQRAADAARSREIPAFQTVRASVQRFIRDEQVEKRKDIATVYHLIPRASAASYRRTLETAARESGLRIIVSGPWPPYAFAET